MVRLSLILLLICSLSSGQLVKRFPFASTTPSGPTWTNLVNWFKLNEISGGTVANSADAGNPGTVYNVTLGSGGATFDSDDDSIVFNGTTIGSSATFLLRVEPNSDGDCDIFGGDIGALKVSFWTAYRMRTLITGGGGTSVYSTSATNSTYQLLSIVVNGSIIRYGINGANYENQTWGETITSGTDRIGGSRYDLNEFRGRIRDFVEFSDVKSDSYITAFYNSGTYTEYEDGDPE